MESSCPVRTNSWVWASTPGVTRTRTLGRSRGRRGRLEQPAQPCHLVEGVHHDAPDAGLEGGGELVGRLVVAVQDEPGGGYPGRQGDVELSAGGDVEVHALLVGQPGHGPAEEGLGGVGHTVTPGGDRLPAGAAQVVLVVDEQRRAELGGQVEQVDAPDPEVARPHPPRPCAAGGDARSAPWRRRGRGRGRGAGGVAPGCRDARGTTGPTTVGTTVQNTAGRRRLRPAGTTIDCLFVRPRGVQPAPVAQRIEHRPPEPVAQVRVLPGAL